MSYDSKLHDEITETLKFEPSLDSENITISVKDNGIVVLAGKVKSYAEKYTAEDAVKKIERVKAIANEIEVDLALEYKRGDVEIAQHAIHALQWNVFIPDKKIKVTVSEGHLTLSGEVEYYFQRKRAEKAVRDIIGIKGITNKILVRPKVSASDVKEKIVQEFERNAKLDASKIEVEIRGDEIVLRGEVKNFDEEQEAIDAAWSIPGVSKVTDLLTIAW